MRPFKEYYEENKERIRNQQKEYYAKNRLTIIKRTSKNSTVKRQTNINERLKANIRRRINHIIKGKCKSLSAIKELGCSIENLKTYLQDKFIGDMSWDNYGLWHIDHIIPLSRFDLTKQEEFKKAVHYTNLQPLWAVDNIRKKNK